MKNRKIQDERVVSQQRQIQSDGFVILLFILLVSVIVQRFIMDAPYEQYAVELISFLGMSVYLVIRNIIHGNNLLDDGKQADGKQAKVKLLVNILLTSIIATTIHGVLNYSMHYEHYENNIGLFIAVLAIFFVSITILALAVYSLLAYLSKKRRATIHKQLDEDEQDES